MWRAMGKEDDEGWATKQGKRYECCGTDACPGICPRFVILAGQRPGGTKARCRECNVVFKLPRGDSKTSPKASPKAKPKVKPGSLSEKDSQKAMREKDKRIKQLEQQIAAKAKASEAEVASDEAMDVEEPADAALAGIDDLVQQLKDFKAASESTKRAWALVLGDAKTQQSVIDCKRQERRANLPPSARQRGVNERLKKAEASQKAAQGESSKLQKELEELQARKLVAKQHEDSCTEMVATLRREAAEVASAVAAEKAKVAEVEPGEGSTAQHAFVARPHDAALLSSVLCLVQHDAFAQFAESHGVTEAIGVAAVRDFADRVRAACPAQDTPSAQSAPNANSAVPQPFGGEVSAAAKRAAEEVPVEKVVDDDLDECMLDAQLTPEQRDKIKASMERKKKERKQ